jgi:hypothetical protein
MQQHVREMRQMHAQRIKLPGTGKLLVVDGGGSLRFALVGDKDGTGQWNVPLEDGLVVLENEARSAQ